MPKRHDHHHYHHHEKRRKHSMTGSESSDGDSTGDSEARNRDEVSKRSRMWRTVSSSSSEDGSDRNENVESKGDINVRRSSSSSHDTKTRHHKKEHKKKHKKKQKHKHKKSKHKRDKEKDRESSNNKNKGAVNQQEFGKYGILRESDSFKKQQEFEAWMVEQKKIQDAGLLGKAEIKELFREYMEDYNTATLPHEKYVNYEKWELKEYEIKQRKLAKKRAGGVISKSDEAQLAEEQRRSKAQKEKDNYQKLIMSTMKSGKVKEMRQQELLRSEMQVAYKKGDVEKVKKLEARLKPDETDQT